MVVPKASFQRFGRIGWLGLFVATAFFFYYPVNSGLVRLFLVAAVPALLVGAMLLLWRWKRWRFIPVAMLAFAVLAFLLPGRRQDPDRLRAQYVASLRPYESARYVWGGENRFGIDCSGLARKGLIIAHLREAALTLNPGHLRNAAALWWHDCSARALKDEYRGWTRVLFRADSVNAIDVSRLLPGDLAVTADGVHVLIHVGDAEWIEADPGLGRVFKAHAPLRNPWFEKPVSVVRWRRLERSGS